MSTPTGMRLFSTQHLVGKDATSLMTKLHTEGYEEIETGDPFIFVLEKGPR
jgi:hypothetical protein